jgi:hypothetical protein
MRVLRQLCALFSLTFWLAGLSFAQAPTGDISGTVFDESGAVVPGVTVVIANQETGFSRTFTTGSDGVFSATAIAAGVYEVRAEVPGFRTILRQATVQTGAVTTVDLHLQVGATKDVVTVEAAAPQVDYERNTVEGVVSRQQIQNLPLNGRSFLQLAFLEPGVTVSAGSQGQYNRAFDVSVLGGDSNTTRITVDGANIRDAVTGGTQQNFSQESVQEFQVSEINFDLSTGIGSQGAVNVITRTGSNDLHGSGFFFYRDHNLSAYPSLQRDPTDPNPFFARRQPGVWVGGPVKKDKLFFFANYEHNNQDGIFSTLPNDPDFRSLATLTNSPFHESLIGVRFDYRINDKNTFFIRYSHDSNNSFAPQGGGLPSSWVSNTNYADSGVASLITTFTPALVNEARYSMTYWDNKNTIPSATQCPDCLGLGGAYVNVDGTGLSFGNQTNTPQSRVLRRNIFADNMTWQKGSHRMKFGGEWEYQKGTGTYHIDEPAAITLYSPEEVAQLAPQLLPLLPTSYNTIQDVLRLPLMSFSFGFGDANQPPPYMEGNADHDNTFHFYWQDTWKYKPRLTLNYGLGYTYESNALNHDLSKPSFLEPIFGQNGLGPEKHAPFHFSPAAGFAYQLTKDAKTVLRGGFGIYYNTIDIELRLIERNYLGPFGAGYLTLGGSDIPNPIPGIPGVPQGTPLDFSSGPTPFSGALLNAILPSILTAVKAEVPLNPNNTSLALTTIEFAKQGTELFWRDYVPPSAQHFNLGIQRQVTNDLAITADFVYRHDVHLTERDIDANHYHRYINGVQTPVLPICTGNQASIPTYPCSTGEIDVTGSGGTDVYRGLLLKVDKRFAHRYQLQGAYALQFQNGIEGIYNLDNWYEYRGPQGSRNVLNISGIVDLPWKFQVSFISSYQSPGAFIPVIPGVDLTGSGINGFPLPGLDGKAINAGISKSQFVNLVNQYNQTYGGKPGPVPGQTFPTITLPTNYSFGRSFNSQDVRLTKFFKFRERYELQIFMEGFNVFNIANLGGYSNNLLDPSFGQATSRAGNIFGTGGPRAFQAGGRFSF